MAKFGTSPPYDNSQDRARFATWFHDIARNRDEGKARHEGSIFMSSAIADRYDDPDYVHCWVRTHEMVDDLKGCLEQYEACGGEHYDREALDDPKRVAAAKARADEGIPPSKYAACSSFFNSTLVSTVMQSEAALVERYGLGKCCSD